MPTPATNQGLQHLLENTSNFLVAVEIETSRGLAMEEEARKVSDLARRLTDIDGISLVCLTDNPGGNPHIRPEVLGQDLLYRGQEVTINVSCKDYNRNGIESRLWALGSMGFRNVLALSGDYPTQGFEGQAQPVFDIDSVGLLEMMRRMNEGLPARDWGSVGREVRLERTNFFPGAAVNPFKKLEGELMTQYFKLAMKARCGAGWGVTQIGYDSRKLDELLRYMKRENFEIPMFGSVFVLSAGAASFFNRWGIPGVAVNNRLMELAQDQAGSGDRGRAFFEELAAKQIAVLRGLGYRGVYLSGRPRLDRIQRILDIEGQFAGDDWKSFADEIHFPQDREFYFFEPGDGPGRSSDAVNAEYLESKEKGASRRARIAVPVSYRIGRIAHSRAFDPKSLGFRLGRAIYSKVEKSRRLSRLFHIAEQSAKVPLYGCRDCGDCSLPDIAYLCPESQCVKNQRNGPCGGTRAGKCEVLDKDCIWLRAYDRLKPFGEEESMLQRPPVFRDAALRGTSAWANTFLGRDHHAKLRRQNEADSK